MPSLIDSGQAETQIQGGVERDLIQVSTNASGEGSSVVQWSESFRETEIAVFTQIAESGSAYPSSAGSSQATIQVEGASTEATVDVFVLAVGDR